MHVSKDLWGSEGGVASSDRGTGRSNQAEKRKRGREKLLKTAMLTEQFPRKGMIPICEGGQVKDSGKAQGKSAKTPARRELIPNKKSPRNSGEEHVCIERDIRS